MARPGRTAILAAGAAMLGVALAAGVWLTQGAAEEMSALPVADVGPRILFDDFDYPDERQLAAGGWLVRATAGGPGIPGAGWAGVSLVGEPGGRMVRLTARTDGTAAGTTQALLCHEPKYREGTSAARVRLRDGPVSGPAVDALAEAFAGASAAPDGRGQFAFEYRPGEPRPALDLASPAGPPARVRGSRAGWHILVAQVADDAVAYYVDGKPVATRRGRGRAGAAALGFGLWLERIQAGPVRRYEVDVDWVFHQADVVLSPEQVAGAVASLRRLGIGFQDSVPSTRASALSPCEASR